jgi:multidrug efflux pump subunit AcrA (membrane-fusion protein)
MGGRGGGGPAGDFSLVIMRLVKPGSQVKSGDVLCEFDPQLQLQRLDDYKDSVVQMENNIKKMLANLAANRESHDQQVRTAKADYDKAVLDLQTAEVRSAIDAEKFKLAVEEADLKHKELVRQSALVEESQQGQIRSSELDRDQSKIEMARSEANVQRMTIKSPMDGIVVMNTINRSGDIGQIREGDSVSSGQPFMSVVDPTSMVLNAAVNQVDAERLRLGLKATVRLDAYGDIELPGALIGIGAMAKISRFRAGYVGEIPVRLKIEKMDPRVIPDLTGSAQIVVNSERNTLILPREAIFEENGGPFVFLQGPQGWMRKKVDLGLPNFTVVAVHSGVQKGDVVAIQRPM